MKAMLVHIGEFGIKKNNLNTKLPQNQTNTTYTSTIQTLNLSFESK